ncbi:MAG: transglycosylase SLT domain-containing protein, partial [Bacteroidia bacterium]|nr:transglycosylase SLT domain-containing protein [Bacteroidia bacterium]
MRKFFRVLLLFIVLLPACKKAKEAVHDFPQIIANDTLRVITLNASTSYFIYRDQEMGYHYEMIKNFADEHGLQLQIVVAKNPAMLASMLQNNRGDVVAFNVPVENTLKDSILYCGLSGISHQVLVQRAERNDTVLKDVTELIGRDVYVLRGSKYDQRMNNLNRELGGGVNLRYVDKDTIVVEDLIRMVSAGDIRYTVADEYVARLNHTYFININIDMPVSFDQRTSWAVRKDAPALADSLNAWFSRTSLQPNYLRLTKRYFEEAKGFHADNRSTFITMFAPGQISPWDEYFKQYGKQFGVDWRLLASVSYYESTFDPDGKSWAGAGGLMGLMPATAAALGVNGSDIFEPETNIRVGAEYLKTLIRLFSSVEDETERIKMALASYNGGIGHVTDARALAEKYEADKNVWNGNVEKFLQLKRLEQYYRDPVC